MVDVAVSRRMGLFVVARLAARHGIRIRLRPADTGGLVALVWLPDEAITREAPDSPLGLHRPGALAAVNLAVGEAAGRSGVEQELSAARAPRFAPLRVDADDTNPDLPRVAAQGPRPGAAWATVPQGAEPGSGDSDEPDGPDSPALVAVLPGDALAEENRLPIFEAVESDWFRRGGQAVDRFGRDALIGSGWASPADAGWRAAEVVHSPSSGGTTQAGLPKRVPRANLVPGTAAAPAEASSPVPSARSAAATRDRFASFQRGVSRGRAVVSGEGPDDGEDETSDET